jgi:hypothetical protein
MKSAIIYMSLMVVLTLWVFVTEGLAVVLTMMTCSTIVLSNIEICEKMVKLMLRWVKTLTNIQKSRKSTQCPTMPTERNTVWLGCVEIGNLIMRLYG